MLRLLLPGWRGSRLHWAPHDDRGHRDIGLLLLLLLLLQLLHHLVLLL